MKYEVNLWMSRLYLLHLDCDVSVGLNVLRYVDRPEGTSADLLS